ncbi:hypothetical protein P7K49_035252 [Saguinus oedipus]|uniref:Uncharacterized protein n=1 Tax=Saguinus oedipus TaxID=9490 RepID=A0ABQ9TM31_SAGOE|nr:hypothetical protein P7K49_035252 [Saguinus oedipus]
MDRTLSSEWVSDGQDTLSSEWVSDGQDTRSSERVSDGQDTRSSERVSDGQDTESSEWCLGAILATHALSFAQSSIAATSPTGKGHRQVQGALALLPCDPHTPSCLLRGASLFATPKHHFWDRFTASVLQQRLGEGPGLPVAEGELQQQFHVEHAEREGQPRQEAAERATKQDKQ